MAHDKEPSFHSWNKPKRRIIKKEKAPNRRGKLRKDLKAAGVGINKTISISKTKKITARRKNRVEKGIRALFLGSKPHSKGEAFSRSLLERALNV